MTLPTLVTLLVVMEVFFRFGIPASYPPPGFFDEEALIYRHKAGPSDGLFTIGSLAQQRARWHMNNYGWNSPVDYYPTKDKQRVAVIGDSYIEAFQVDVDKNYPALLDSAIEDMDVYSFGISGAPLSQYLHMSRYVNRVFDPDVLVVNLILNDFDESIYDGKRSHWLTLKINGDSVEEVQPRTNPGFAQYSPTRQAFRRSALVRYLFFNLKMPSLVKRLFADKNSFEENTNRNRLRARHDEIGAAILYIMNRIRAESPNRRIIYVIDGPKQNIYAGTMPSEEILYIYDVVESGAAETNAEFLNLWPLMKDKFAQNGKKFNSEYDGHWDTYGHAFVAEQVLPVLARNSTAGVDSIVDPSGSSNGNR